VPCVKPETRKNPNPARTNPTEPEPKCRGSYLVLSLNEIAGLGLG